VYETPIVSSELKHMNIGNRVCFSNWRPCYAVKNTNKIVKNKKIFDILVLPSPQQMFTNTTILYNLFTVFYFVSKYLQGQSIRLTNWTKLHEFASVSIHVHSLSFERDIR
jgi:hypothetical protein